MNTRPIRQYAKRRSAACSAAAPGRDSVLHLLVMMLITVLCITCAFPAFSGSDVYAASFSASGTVNAGGGAVLRAQTTTSSQEKAVLSNGTQVTITREIFRKDGKTAADTRWYLVKANGKSGYVRSDLVTNVSYPSNQAYMKTRANIRSGPSAKFSKLGRLKKGTPLTVHGKARVTGEKMWYMAEADGQIFYVNTKYVTFQAPASAGQTAAAAEAAPAADTAAPAHEAAAAQAPAQTAQPEAVEETSASAPAKQAAAPASSGTVSVTISGATQPSSLETGKGFAVKGKITSSAPMTRVVAGVTDVNGSWFLQASSDVNADKFDLAKLDSQLKFGTLTKGKYKYRVDVYVGSTCYNKISSDFEVLGIDFAAKLSSKPTSGGSARIIGTLDTSNCSKLFAVKGTKSAQVPQGMTINGDRYYLVYGMSGKQAIVTYSSSGKKIAEKSFPFNMGHPNGITWDPKTGLCYIFKGNTSKCYTWNPADNSFGTARTPYSSSGIAYDGTTGFLYATSHTGVREYSADGRFSHRRLFSRCRHSGRTYIQDCGASNGFVFHCISGSNKHKTNYLDVYREADGKYLGTFKINIDEAESAEVGPDGYVQILCNTTDSTDYIWKTPVNVRELH